MPVPPAQVQRVAFKNVALEFPQSFEPTTLIAEHLWADKLMRSCPIATPRNSVSSQLWTRSV
eukprot:4621706-Amphidinium_carterae.1